MASLNNPAGRLYFLLADFLKLKDISLEEAWTITLKLENPQVGDLLIALTDVILQMKEAKDAVGKLNVNHKLYLQPFINIQRLFSLSLGHNMVNAKEIITEHTMNQLLYCDELLSRMSPELLPDKDKLEELRERLSALYQEVVALEIDPNLKDLILSNLTALISAIEHFRISGVKGIEIAAERSVGSMLIYLQKHPQEHDENSKQAVSKFLQAVLATISLVADVPSVIESGKRVITLLTSSL